MIAPGLRSPASVAHVIWEGCIGGIERLVHQMAKCQIRDGMHVAVAFADPVGPFAEALAADQVDVLDLGVSSGFELRPSIIRETARRLRPFDVLHVHAFNVPLGLASILAGRPIVYTEHGSYGIGRRFGAQKRGLQRLYLSRPSITIAANSRYTAQQLASYYQLGSDQVRMVHNGVDFGRPPDQTARNHTPELIVGFVGRWVQTKRLDRLLHAIVLANQHADVRLVMVGGGPYEQGLRRLATNLGISEVVEFVGPRLELDDVLDRMDVLVQTGVESFGLSIVEACGRGVLPAVFADGGGAVEVLPPDGLVVDSVEALGHALATLGGTPALGAPARATRAAWARENFGIGETVAGYQRLYERALQKG